MSQTAGLDRFSLIAFVTVSDSERALTFYRDTLGLALLSDELPFALVFNANGIMLRVAHDPEAKPVRGTILGWRVPQIQAAVADLVQAGVVLERYSFMPQDEAGVWHSPSGAKVAWFKDPDGNLLSVSEHPE